MKPGIARLLALAILLTATATAACAASPPARWNILWITCEDMSPDLGCYGAPNANTPNLDGLAAQGMRFTNAFATSPVCSPSRSTIITGRYAASIGTHNHRSKVVLPADTKCFTELLRANGYYCTNNMKTDYNFEVPRAAWDANSRQAHWRRRASGQPFFSVFNLTATHEGRFHLDDEHFRAQATHVPQDRRHDPSGVQLPPYYPDTPAVRNEWARYQDMITEMDAQAGELLKQLDDDGLTTSTIVFFFSDHGRGLPRGKRWLYDSGLRVPLVVRWPGRFTKAPVVTEDLVSLIDMAPTVLALAGIEPPNTLQGQIILGDTMHRPRETIYATRDQMDETTDTIRCARNKQFKYIRNFYPEIPYSQVIEYAEKTATMREMRRLHTDGQLTGPQALFFQPRKPSEELYDIVADPHEIRNLAASPEHEKVLKQMRRELDDWMRAIGDKGVPQLPPPAASK